MWLLETSPHLIQIMENTDDFGIIRLGKLKLLPLPSPFIYSRAGWSDHSWMNVLHLNLFASRSRERHRVGTLEDDTSADQCRPEIVILARIDILISNSHCYRSVKFHCLIIRMCLYLRYLFYLLYLLYLLYVLIIAVEFFHISWYPHAPIVLNSIIIVYSLI